jgi:dethiobiotin synthetase
MTALLITATGTGIGKTTVTACIALLAAARGERVSVIKPAQTGERDGVGGDLAFIAHRVPDADLIELGRYPAPLAPSAAARLSGRPPVSFDKCLESVLAAELDHDLVLVEGAGGLLVPYDETGWNMRKLAAAAGMPAVVVTAAGLGTLNATALTLEALERWRIPLYALVLGSWPEDPGLPERSNITDLEHLAARPLAGALPVGMARLDQLGFAHAASQALVPALGGVFDAEAFRDRYAR